MATLSVSYVISLGKKACLVSIQISLGLKDSCQDFKVLG